MRTKVPEKRIRKHIKARQKFGHEIDCRAIHMGCFRLHNYILDLGLVKLVYHIATEDLLVREDCPYSLL